jgi:hypothetical protein
MSSNTKNDPTDPATKRPNSPPLNCVGNKFIPMDIPDFGYEIQLPESASCDDPISLFDLYYSPEIMDELVRYTNEAQRNSKDPQKPHCRAGNWYPTCRSELYTYLGIRIYMTLHVENEISDYWNTSNITPNHYIQKYMTRDRFQELHLRFRCHGSNTSGPYEKGSYYTTKPFPDFLKLISNIEYRLNFYLTTFSELILKFGALVPT